MSNKFFRKIDINLSKEWIFGLENNLIENNNIHVLTKKIVNKKYYDINDRYLQKSETLYKIVNKFAVFIVVMEIPSMYFFSWHRDVTRKSLIMFPVQEEDITLRRTLFTDVIDPNEKLNIEHKIHPNMYPSFNFYPVNYEFGKANILNANEYYHCGINLSDKPSKMILINCKFNYEEMCDSLKQYTCE